MCDSGKWFLTMGKKCMGKPNPSSRSQWHPPHCLVRLWNTVLNEMGQWMFHVLFSLVFGSAPSMYPATWADNGDTTGGSTSQLLGRRQDKEHWSSSPSPISSCARASPHIYPPHAYSFPLQPHIFGPRFLKLVFWSTQYWSRLSSFLCSDSKNFSSCLETFYTILAQVLFLKNFFHFFHLIFRRLLLENFLRLHYFFVVVFFFFFFFFVFFFFVFLFFVIL